MFRTVGLLRSELCRSMLIHFHVRCFVVFGITDFVCLCLGVPYGPSFHLACIVFVITFVRLRIQVR